MNKNHILTIASLVILMVASITTTAAVIVPGTETNNSAKTEDPKVQQLTQRIHEIKAMNKSELTRTEKKDMRKELKQTKKEMKAATSGGVYLSVGAIIIIILILILIL